jgi:RND superfamily putative drug exporter
LLVFQISNFACEKVTTYAFGLSALVWQHLIGLPLHWLVLPLTFIIRVAVGSDYNVLLITRVKEELHAGLHTGSTR